MNFISEWEELFSNAVFSFLNISFDNKEKTFDTTWNSFIKFFKDKNSEDFLNNIDTIKEIYDELRKKNSIKQ
jgi:flagellar motor component MotA